MKKIRFLVLFLIAAMLLPVLTACKPKDYDNVLRIYNWEDYMSNDILEGFKEYYKKKTNKTIEIQYEAFDTNETMFTKLDKGKEYYDLICPSDYMIQRLINADLIEPLDDDKLTDYNKYVSKYIDEKFKDIISKDDKRYAIGYMWGFLGILYNIDKVEAKGITEDEIQSWEILFNSQFKNEVYMKDSIRDTFAALAIYAYRDELASGATTVDTVLKDSSDEMLERLVKAMKDQQAAVSPVYEVDEAKSDMADGNYSLALMWSGDAYAAIEEGLYTYDDEGNAVLKPENKQVNLGFALPKEGNNVFFDGFAIPKQKRSDEKKQMIYDFLNYISLPENALKNVEEIGYTSVIAGDKDHKDIFDFAVDSEFQINEVDASYFFDSEHFGDIGLLSLSNIMFPDKSYIEDSCAIMYDYGARTQEFNDAWIKARGTEFPAWAIVLIVVGSVLIVLAVLCFIFREKIRAFINKKFPDLLKKKPKDVSENSQTKQPTETSPKQPIDGSPTKNGSSAVEPETKTPTTSPETKAPEKPSESKLPPEFDDDDDEFIPPVK
jgi:spermidine/putrescine transport system substrate-binding protein